MEERIVFDELRNSTSTNRTPKSICYFRQQVDKSKFIDTNIIPRGGFCNGNKFFVSSREKRI